MKLYRVVYEVLGFDWTPGDDPALNGNTWDKSYVVLANSEEEAKQLVGDKESKLVRVDEYELKQGILYIH